MAKPLNELLSGALADLTDAESLETHLNLLRVLPADVRDVPKLARVSKRNVQANVVAAKRLGWITAGDAKHLELTAAGRAAHTECRRRIEIAEAAWADRNGEKLRSSLEALVSKFDLELPHHPATYGPADGSVTGGVAMRWGRRAGDRGFDPVAERDAAEAWEKESGGRIYLRETGQDWRPVPRTQNDVKQLPLFALLSQTLMAFASDYESCGGVSLARRGNTLRLIGDDGVEVALRVGRSRGETKLIPVGFGGVERHRYASVAVDPDDKLRGRLTLTEKGRRVRDSYEGICADIERRWKRRYGAAVVGSVRSALTQAGTQ